MTSLKIGDTVTIRRGKLKGETGKVETVSGTQIVVRLTNGTLLLQNVVNLKAPEEATIGATFLADAFQEVAGNYTVDHGGRELSALVALADRLAQDLPGFSADSFDWPAGYDPNASITVVAN